MENWIKIVSIDNVVEAKLLESVLKSEQIPHLIETFHDTAYDGLFQNYRGWGIVRAPVAYRAKILEIVEDLRREDA